MGVWSCSVVAQVPPDQAAVLAPGEAWVALQAKDAAVEVLRLLLCLQPNVGVLQAHDFDRHNRLLT
jgi:hypothetical protein